MKPYIIHGWKAFCVLILFFCFLFTTAVISARNNQCKRVLIIHSYHKGLAWTDGEEKAIRSTFYGYPDVELYTEYLDSKRKPLKIVSDSFATYLKHKYSDKPPDIIICSDNNALTFLQEFHKDLFPGTPVVFCGINNYKPDMLNGFDNKITGIIQELEPLETIQIIKKLQPKFNNLVIIGGTTPTAKAIMSDVKNALSESNIKSKFHVQWWQGLSTDTLIEKLKKLSPNDAILLCNFNRDKKGVYYTHQESAKMIAENSPAPVYAMEDHYIGTGVIGGYMNTSQTQGQAAAKLAITILDSNKIPSVIDTCPNVALFDYKAIIKHKLKISHLPKNTVTINSPEASVMISPEHFWTAVGIFMLLVISVAVLSLNNARRYRSEMNLQVTLQSIGDAVISTDIDGCVHRMNNVAEKLTGWQLKNAKGQRLEKVFNIVNAQTGTPVKNPVEKVLNTGRIVGLANHTLLISKNKKKYQIADSAAPIKDHNDKIIGVVLVFRNVNKEYALKAELQETIDLYSALFDNSLAGILAAEVETKNLIFANPGICRMLGYSQNELLKKNVKDIHPKNELKHIISEFKEQADGTKRLAVNLPFLRKDGEIIYADVSTNKTVFNEIDCNVAIITDITDKIKAEKLMRENELRYKTFFENSSDAMLIIEDYKFVDCNNATVKMLEYNKKAELLNTHPSELSPEIQPDGRESLEKAKEMMDKALKQGSNFFEWNHKKKNGEIFPVEVSLTAVISNDKTVLHTIWRDITQRKNAEKQVLMMQKLKSIGTLAGGIAHDFNNVLLGIYGNISLAKLELDETHAAFSLIEDAEKSLSRATGLTNQLLTFAKGGTPVKQIVKIEELVKEVTIFTLSGSNVKPIFNTARNLWSGEVDKGQIQQVISNLILNANQAMPEGGNIYIIMENENVIRRKTSGLEKGKYVKITIEDEGTGIDKKHFDRIFDPYFTTKQSGNGIGLATAYSIINKHNGRIDLSSELGKGTVFTIHIPASNGKQASDKKSSEKKIRSSRKKGKILIMDDEENVRVITARMLKNIGFSFDTAEDGREAIKKYTKSMKTKDPFNAVLMDLTVPGGMGGQEAVKALLDIDPSANVIVCSGYSNDPVMSHYKQHGFKGVLTKPFQIEDLKKVLLHLS